MALPSVDSQLQARYSLPIVGSVEGAFGMVLIGSYVSIALYGVFLTQTFKYFRRYKADTLWIKGIVITVLVLETVVTVLHAHLAYYYFVENYGNPSAFFRGVWSLNMFAVIAAFIFISCQSFYTVRILLVGPSKYSRLLVITVILLMGGVLGVAMVSTYVGFQGITLENYERLLGFVLAYNVVASSADIILTSTLIYILHRSRTGFKGTDSMINKLIRYAISTGLVTTIFNAISFVLVHVYGIQNWVWLGMMMIAERLYSNSLMTALNSRKFTSKKRGDDDTLRFTEVYGTAGYASTGNNSSVVNEGIELPQAELGVISIEANSSVGDVKTHPFGEVQETV